MKLTVQLVPSTSFYENVRSICSKTQWDFIRKDVYKKYSYKCAICGGKGDKHPVEAHEVWKYDDNNYIQILTDILAVCPACHTSIHFGLACVRGKQDKALSHLKIVNGISIDEAQSHVKRSFEEFNRRSKHQWTLDVSYLEKYGIDVSQLQQR